jgi:hypothetical protein
MSEETKKEPQALEIVIAATMSDEGNVTITINQKRPIAEIIFAAKLIDTQINQILLKWSTSQEQVQGQKIVRPTGFLSGLKRMFRGK